MMSIRHVPPMASGSFLIASGLPAAIMKVAIQGGTPGTGTGGICLRLVSPDGKSVVFAKQEGQGSGATVRFVVQTLDGKPLQEVAVPPSEPLRWTPDGRAITYIQFDPNAECACICSCSRFREDRQSS